MFVVNDPDNKTTGITTDDHLISNSICLIPCMKSQVVEGKTRENHSRTGNLLIKVNTL